MNKTEIITLICCTLKAPMEIAVLAIGRINFDWLKTLPAEEAAETVEEMADSELMKEIARKLYPFYRMGRLKTEGPLMSYYNRLNPDLMWYITQRMYEDGNAYPFPKMLARYRGLCALGSRSLAYAESQKELMTIYDRVDPVQINAYILELVINMPDGTLIPPIM